ncbi:MAG: sensor histidine kinase [Chloroflexi bacterium]|nr:sensor histidine kinase [Chloroflexota bacterium]
MTFSGVNTHVGLGVRDQGVGIPANDQTRVFEPFYRGSNIGETFGVGLGLSLVSRAVTALRGRIDLESVPQQGSTFTVALAKHL